MSRGEMEVIAYIAYWYASPDGTFLRLFSREKSWHDLPKYSMYKIVMEEVSYHLPTWFSTLFHRKNKEPWPTIPLQIGLYKIKNFKVTDTEGKEILKFEFGTRDFNPYDPCGIYTEHCARIYFLWLVGQSICQRRVHGGISTMSLDSVRLLVQQGIHKLLHRRHQFQEKQQKKQRGSRKYKEKSGERKKGRGCGKKN